MTDKNQRQPLRPAPACEQTHKEYVGVKHVFSAQTSLYYKDNGVDTTQEYCKTQLQMALLSKSEQSTNKPAQIKTKDTKHIYKSTHSY